MSEETGENLAEVKASLEMVFNNIRTLKREVLYVNQKLSSLDSTIQDIEEFSSKFIETEKILGDLKTSIQELNPLSKEIHEIKHTISVLQQTLGDQTTKQADLLNPVNEAITNVQSKLTTFDHDLLKIPTLEESIAKLEGSFQELNVSFSHQEAKITEIQATLSNISPSVDALKSNYEKNNEIIQKLEEGIIEYKTTTEEKLDQLMNDSVTKAIDEFGSKFESLNTRITNIESSFEETNTNVTNSMNQIQEVTTSTSGFLNRIQNLEEKAGISTGDLISTGFDNLGMLQQLITDLLGREKVDQHIPREAGQDPVMVIKGLKGIIRDISCIDETNSLNTSEILLNYSETSDGRADRRALIVNFNKDIQRVLEIGQSVLMDIGQKRMQTRNFIEEIRNLARQWTSEDDIRGESGVFMALDLLETLEKEF